MATVPLSFIPPIESDITTLHIWEAPTADGPWSEIESVSAGIYPVYKTRYTTQDATNLDDWFAIQWENAEGARTELSDPIKGGTTTLVGEIVDRVLLRTPNENENIVVQEAEATISYVYRVDDPYSIDPTTVSRLWMTELTNLTLVASQYVNVVTQVSAGQEYTAGLISQSVTQGTNSLEALDKLEKRALKRLGIGGSLLASIQEQIDCGVSFTGVRTTFDSSRVLSTRSIITENALVQDLDSGLVISDR